MSAFRPTLILLTLISLFSQVALSSCSQLDFSLLQLSSNNAATKQNTIQQNNDGRTGLYGDIRREVQHDNIQLGDQSKNDQIVIDQDLGFDRKARDERLSDLSSVETKLSPKGGLSQSNGEQPQTAEFHTNRSISPAVESIGAEPRYAGKAWSALADSKGHTTEIIDISPLDGTSGALSISRSGDVIWWRASPKSASNPNLSDQGKLLTSIVGGVDRAAVAEKSGLIAYSRGTSLSIFSIGAGKQVASQPRIKSRVSSLQFDREERALLIAGADGVVYRWRFADEQALSSDLERERCFERYFGHSSIVSQAAFHPIGRVFFSADWRGALNAWLPYDADAFGGEYDHNLFGGRGYADKSTRMKASSLGTEGVTALVVSRDGEKLFTGLQNGSIEWWKVRGFARVKSFPIFKSSIMQLDIDPLSKYLAVLGRGGKLKILQLTSAQVVGTSNLTYEALPVLEHAVEEGVVAKFVSPQEVLVGAKNGNIVEVHLPMASEVK